MAVYMLTCPACQSAIRSAQPAVAGKTIVCPKCRKPFAVAARSAPTPKPAVAQAQAVAPSEPAGGSTRSKSSGMLAWGTLAAVVLIGGGAGGYLWYAGRTGDSAQPQAGQPTPGQSVALAGPTADKNAAVAGRSTEAGTAAPGAGGSGSAPVVSAPLASAAGNGPIAGTAAQGEPARGEPTARNPTDGRFFHDGETAWKIWLSPNADPTEQFAAEELSAALKKISGAMFYVDYSDHPPDGPAIVIGDLKHPLVKSQAAALKLEPGKIEQLAVYTLGDRLYLAGNQPRGALYAVYHFLRQELGVRWLWPGPEGEFMPAKTSWSLPRLNSNYRPTFMYRGFHLCGDWRDVDLFREWMGRNFINIYRHAASAREKRRGFYCMYSDHNATLPATLFNEHPEYFAEIKGKRYASNICFSHPETERIVLERMKEAVRKRPELDILSIFPVDNEDYCRCEKCARTDTSTNWFAFYNRVTDELKREFPNLKFGTIAYQGYRAVPQCKIRNSEFVEYASYGRCNIHSYGTADCKPNEETLVEMRAWKATGVPIGNYSYEYDIFSKNRRFTPFLSVIESAVRTSRDLGHVSVIPEVLLHPKDGPDEQAAAIQNRLSLYLYARLLWDPEQSTRAVVDDWCRTVYDDAAQPMAEYFTALDRDWTAMPTHFKILGDALRIAPHFMTEQVRSEATKDFAAAESRLAEIADAAARRRAAAALQRERALLNQWEDLHRLNSGAERMSLPLLAQAGDFARTGSRVVEFGIAAKSPTAAKSPAAAKSQAGYATRVSAAWTADALLVRWTCLDPKIKTLKAAAAERDGRVAEDDSVELELSTGSSGETWHLAVNSKGTQHDWRITNVGVREDGWNPEWRATAKPTAGGPSTGQWEVEMTIPFAALGQTPNPSESWQARFVRHNGGRKDFAETAFPDGETIGMLFSASSQGDRTLLWWSGLPDKEASQGAAITQEFAESGWQIHLLSDAQQLAAVKQPCDVYWFRHPNGSNKFPAESWDKISATVNAGATAVFVSYLPIPLDEYFRDPSSAVKLVTCGAIPLAERKTASVTAGDWSKQPNDLEGRLKSLITPAYGFEPVTPAAWTVLATANGVTGPYPYLLVRRHGKGLIVLMGADIPLPRAKLLENLLRYQAEMK